jgi:hypothetical protein
MHCISPRALGRGLVGEVTEICIGADPTNPSRTEPEATLPHRASHQPPQRQNATYISPLTVPYAPQLLALKLHQTYPLSYPARLLRVPTRARSQETEQEGLAELS